MANSNTTNTANGALFTSVAGTALVFGFDSNGNPTVTLPAIATAPTPGQSAIGDDAAVKAHDIQSCQVIDGTNGVVIDIIPAFTVRTYQASSNGVWLRSDGRILIGHPGGAPANTTTPVNWFEACTPNGNIIGRVPIYQ